MADTPANVRRNRIKLILLFLLFFGPTVGAWILFESGWRPVGTVNRGKLVEPVEPVAQLEFTDVDGRAVPEEAFFGHWTLLVSASGECAELCGETLNQVGRVHVALNKDMDRVQPGLVLPPQAQVPELPEHVLRLRAPEGRLQALAASAEAPEGGVAVHLLDYRGQRMMTYPAPLDASGLLKDLRRLLKLSNEEAERYEAPREQSR